MLPLHHRDILLVQPRGIEPLSTDLQTAAMTTSAKVALFIGVSDGDRTHAYRNHNPRPYHLATDTIQKLSAALESTVALLFLAHPNMLETSQVQCCSSVATQKAFIQQTHCGQDSNLHSTQYGPFLAIRRPRVPEGNYSPEWMPPADGIYHIETHCFCL